MIELVEIMLKQEEIEKERERDPNYKPLPAGMVYAHDGTVVIL